MPIGFYQRSVQIRELEQNDKRRIAISAAKGELAAADGSTFIDVAVEAESPIKRAVRPQPSEEPAPPTMRGAEAEAAQLGKNDEKEGGHGLKVCTIADDDGQPCPACDSYPDSAPDDSAQLGKSDDKPASETLKPSALYSDE
jgi:hypothetical protein